MEKAAFSLEGYRFEYASFNLKDVETDSILNLDFVPSGIYRQNEGLYNLEFVFKAWRADNEEIPVVEVKCKADFKFNSQILLEDIPCFFYPNSIAILYPYIRAFVSTLTLQANMKSILLPTLNLSSLQDTLRNNTVIK